MAGLRSVRNALLVAVLLGLPALLLRSSLQDPRNLTAIDRAVKKIGAPLEAGISYAAGLAVVGLCPGARIGVDVTEIAPIPDWDAVAHLYLGTARAVRLSRMSAPERERGFALAWAELEARGKCLGLGLEEWSPARERQLYAASIELTTSELPASHTASHANLMLALAIGDLSG